MKKISPLLKPLSAKAIPTTTGEMERFFKKD